ncbi:hypothetical protein BSL78_06840 [Apostichopus japonicus]|uniref:Uncharacterized protein n=1 Tax=Stichopus japonicus TaxID=307972 RepID=A0A2G8L7K5_STIJA|nr:hypothetical protein BSL78_06840 [Apostichopus japonicus]
MCVPLSTPLTRTGETSATCQEVCEYDEWFRRARCHERNLQHIPTSTGCENAAMLEVHENNIQLINQETVNGYRFVQTLDFSQNQISHIEPGAFLNVSNVKHLLLSNNALVTLRNRTFVGTERHLKRIYLDKNEVAIIEEAAFHGLNKVQYLDLGYNNIQSITSGHFLDMPGLEFLILENNELVSIENDTFNCLISLEVIALNNNKLTSIPNGLFDGLTTLKDIDLSQNRLHTILSPSDLGLLTHLRYLFLADNYINKSTDIVPFFEQSVYLLVGGNPFECDCGFQKIQEWYLNQSIVVKQVLSHSSSLGCYFNGSYIDVTAALPTNSCPTDDDALTSTTVKFTTIRVKTSTEELEKPKVPTANHMKQTVLTMSPSSDYSLIDNLCKKLTANLIICSVIMVMLILLFLFTLIVTVCNKYVKCKGEEIRKVTGNGGSGQRALGGEREQY